MKACLLNVDEDSLAPAPASATPERTSGRDDQDLLTYVREARTSMGALFPETDNIQRNEFIYIAHPNSTMALPSEKSGMAALASGGFCMLPNYSIASESAPCNFSNDSGVEIAPSASKDFFPREDSIPPIPGQRCSTWTSTVAGTVLNVSSFVVFSPSQLDPTPRRADVQWRAAIQVGRSACDQAPFRPDVCVRIKATKNVLLGGT